VVVPIINPGTAILALNSRDVCLIGIIRTSSPEPEAVNGYQLKDEDDSGEALPPAIPRLL
jgi:hypothetical protein